MSSKNKMLVFGLCSTSNDWPSDLKDDLWLKCKKNEKKAPLSHQKIKCLFLDCVQLLMIGQVIWVMNVDWNTNKKKKGPHVIKNKMLIFGLHSTSDDQMSDLSDERQLKQKNEERPPNSSKNKMLISGLRSTSDDRSRDLSNECWAKCKKTEKGSLFHWKNKMLIFGLHSTSDYQPSDLSDECRPNAKKMKKAPLSHQKMKNSFLYYIQLLMIGQVIQATKINWNAKKDPLSHQKMKCLVLDYVQLLMIGWAIWAANINQNAK